MCMTTRGAWIEKKLLKGRKSTFSKDENVLYKLVWLANGHTNFHNRKLLFLHLFKYAQYSLKTYDHRPISFGNFVLDVTTLHIDVQ